MLSEVAGLTKGYLWWVDCVRDEMFTKITEMYMNKNDGKRILIFIKDVTGINLMVCNYRRDALHGVYKSWYSSGQLSDICYYKHDKIIGTYKIWHENGKLGFKTFYVNGVQHGKETCWYPDGRIKYEKYYINGKVDVK